MNAELLELNRNGVRIEHAHHDRFTIWTRQEGSAHFNLESHKLDGEAAVLRLLLHVQFQFTDELDAREQQFESFFVEVEDVGQYPVESVAQTKVGLFRFEVDIGSLERNRASQD